VFQRYSPKISKWVTCPKIWYAWLHPFKSYRGVPNFKFDPDHAHFRG